MAAPASRLDGLLSAWSADRGQFALSQPDGVVRTYDTGTGRLRSTLAAGAAPAKAAAAAPAGQHAEGHCCLLWATSEEAAAAGPSRSWVAVGTASGAVKLYDAASGEVKWQTAGCNEGGVTCLAYAPGRSGQLLSSGRDGQVVMLDVLTGAKQDSFRGSKHGVLAAALSRDGAKLLLGGATLGLWNMDTRQRIMRYTGHPLPLRVITFTPDGSFGLSAGEGELLVAVWPAPDPAAGGKKKKGAVAATSMAVAQPAVQLSTAAAPEGEPAGSFYAAATTEAGEAYVWRVKRCADGSLDPQQLAWLAVEQQHSSQAAIMGAALEPAADGVTVLLAIGSAAKPRFQRLPISSSAAASSKVTYLQAAPADLIRPGAASSSRAAAAAGSQPGAAAGAAPEVLGPDNAGELVQQRGKASRKRGEPEPDAAALGAGSGAAGEAGAAADGWQEEEEEDELVQAEPTLSQRVAQLEQLQEDAMAAAAAAAGASAVAAGGAAAAAAAAPGAGPLKADSLAVLLSQALRSADKALLERCLSFGQPRVITNTVKRLAPLDAALLLHAAVERLQSRPARGQQLAAWVHAVLLHHTAYISAAPAVAPMMSSLYQIIDSRLAVQRQLLSLAGRLELLLAQTGGAAAGGAAAAAAGGPQVVYEETDSEAEVEVVHAAAGDDSDADSDDGSGDGGDSSSEYVTDDGEPEPMEQDGGGEAADDEAGEGEEEDDE